MAFVSTNEILLDGYVLFYCKPFIGPGYCKQYYLCLNKNGYLTWQKCPCLPIKGAIFVQSIIDKIRVSRMNPCKIVNCVKIKGLQPSMLWVLHVPMIVKNKMENRSFIVGEQKQLHQWLDALLGTISGMVPSLLQFSIANKRSLFSGDNFYTNKKFLAADDSNYRNKFYNLFLHNTFII